MSTFKPYADDSSQLTIGDLSVENGTDVVSLHGDIDFARDKRSLEAARTLAAVVQGVVDALEKAGDLPDQATPAARSKAEFKNPFES